LLVAHAVRICEFRRDPKPASNGKTLFAGSSGSCGWSSGERPFVPGDGSAIRGKRCQRGEVDATLARDRQRGRQADGGLEAAVAQARAGMQRAEQQEEAVDCDPKGERMALPITAISRQGEKIGAFPTGLTIGNRPAFTKKTCEKMLHQCRHFYPRQLLCIAARVVEFLRPKV
jgi:hypothetical protein